MKSAVQRVEQEPPVQQSTRLMAVQAPSAKPEVRCGCGHTLFDGLVIKSRVVRVQPTGRAEAKCKRCKEWTDMPLLYSA